MKTILKIACIISIVVATIKLGIMGNLAPETAVIIMIGAVLILAGDKKVFIILAAVLSLYLFIKVYGSGNSQQETILLQGILMLVIILFGFWVMFKGYKN